MHNEQICMNMSNFYQSILMRVQSYMYADVMFLISHKLHNTLCCDAFFCHTCPAFRKDLRME